VTEASSKKSEAISNFLLFISLDHSCIAKVHERAIFFSEYLCYRIIKQITKLEINKYTLMLIYSLCQLKKFVYLCKLKISKNDEKSLVNVLIGYLKENRNGFLYNNGVNNIVYSIMAIIYKQDGVDNLRKCFIPKKQR